MLFTLKRGLFPVTCAQKKRVFVHARIPDGSSCTRAGRQKNSFKKIANFVHFVQVNAHIFDRSFAFDVKFQCVGQKTQNVVMILGEG